MSIAKNGISPSFGELIEQYEHSCKMEGNDLNCVPKQRLRVGNFPTPLQPWNFSWKNREHRFWIKRDDLTDMAASGNKIRKLEFILPEVLVGNHDCILSIGPCQSNSCRILTAIAPRLGLKSAHVLVKTSEKELSFTEGNLFFHKLFDSELFFVSRDEYRKRGQEILLEEAKEKLIESKAAINPYIVPMGGSMIHGVFGYIEAFREIEEQISKSNLEITEIIFACGSGGTAAGLAVGKYLSEKLRRIQLTGYIVWDSGIKHFHNYVNDALDQLGLLTKVKSEELVTFIEAYGKGYGESTEEELDLIRSVARSSGIVLDATYTAKALKMYLESGKEKTNCLFLHTGGMFSIMGRSEYLE
ncbi:putative D-cysteine desulfhydrase 1, mitochondrial [Pseudolycoriella hygida]|uniref:D-cysteine desulfhydrase 1, mitochondrial n=1 Tax=Pseudolycoriella hygida TaxID=35572 RepID=A0A9Q0N6S6_9DIPT|nr:putative D-cysteine desulfhydrase 1, mitochondrial [Pseudolycoriella hygida]